MLILSISTTLTTYGYDTLNRLNGLANSWAGSFGFGYDALSRRTSLTRPNGVNTNYAYDSVSHLLSVLHQTGTTTLDGASYTYDTAGNRTSKTDYLAGVTSNYSYDPLYELTQVTQGASTTESYSYDAVGNRLSSSGVPTYNYNASNELTSNSNGSYTYDANGNTLTDPSGKSYSWDFENRLVQATNPGVGTTTFKYDPFGRRIQKSGPLGTTNYLYDGDSSIEEIDQSGTVIARYVETLLIDDPLAGLRSGTTSYYESDGINSVTSLTNSASTIAATYAYDTFGNLSASTGSINNPFRYTGRELDSETGNYFYRARYSDPTVGRFISEDPIRFGAGVNFYRYVRNSPTSLTDPFGMASALDGMVGGLNNTFPGSDYHPGPNGDATGSWLVVHLPCAEVYRILEAQGYQTGFFPPFNNPWDHAGGWEFRTYGPGFHFRLQYPPVSSMGYGSRFKPPRTCSNSSCTIDQFHIDDPNPMNGMGDAWGHFKKFLASHGF